MTHSLFPFKQAGSPGQKLTSPGLEQVFMNLPLSLLYPQFLTEWTCITLFLVSDHAPSLSPGIPGGAPP